MYKFNKKIRTNTYKLTVVGDAGVGKTSFVSRAIRNVFSDSTDATIGAAFSTYLHKDIKTHECNRYQIWDTAGQERYQALIPMYLRDSHIVCIVYDITNKSSINNIANHWIHFIIKNTKDPHLILIGNKCDLDDKSTVLSSYNNTIHQATQLAEEYGLTHFLTSVKTGKNVNKIFDNTDEYIHNKYNKAIKQPKDALIKITDEYWTTTDENSSCVDARCSLM